MGKKKYVHRAAAMGLCLMLSFFVFAGNSALAKSQEDRHQDRRDKTEARLEKIFERICDRLMDIQDKYPWFHFDLPSFCDDDDDSDEETEAPQVDLEASPMNVQKNGTTTLSWESDDAVSCLASGGWSGAKSLSGNQVATVTATTTYSLACGNEAGTTTDSVTVGILSLPSAPPPTLTFTASTSTIFAGASSTLSWNSANATSCTASNGWSGSKALSGSQVVTPSATTTYALSCTGPGGSIAKNVTINVKPTPSVPLPIVDLNASPLAVIVSGTSTLSWSSSNANLCLASGGWSGGKALNGSQIVTVLSTTTYTLSCSNAAGTTTDSVTVNLVSLPTLDFSGSPTTIEQGASSTLTWDSEHATSCTPSDGWSGSKALDGSQVVSPSATTTYTLTCNGAGGSVAKSVTINVHNPSVPPPPLPTVDLTASPLSVLTNGTSTLTWTSANATLCLASDGWSGTKALNSNQIVTVTATTTYTLACGNTTGTTTDSVTVGITPTPGGPGGLVSILITEVYYDVASTSGAESANEWVELYNPNASPVDLTGFTIADAAASDILPAGSIIPATGFMFITASSTTAGFWSIPGAAKIVNINSPIGNGLGNDNDAVLLKDLATSTVDGVSYGTNTTAFNPGVTDVAEGHSIARSPLTTDTNSAADWIDRATPTPGS